MLINTAPVNNELTVALTLRVSVFHYIWHKHGLMNELIRI